MSKESESPFNLNTAKEMADAFGLSAGIPCDFYSPKGELIYACTCPKGDCFACKELAVQDSKMHFQCKGIHTKAIQQAEQFGGRYIYSCPADMLFSASPIIERGIVVGAVIAGPVRNSDHEEYLENFSAVPFVGPKRMNAISKQLFANAVFLGDEGRELFVAQNKNIQQKSISEFIHQFKYDGQEKPYPAETEQEMSRAIAEGDKSEAAGLLNELLGYIFFSTGGNQNAVQARVTELVVVLSRAAISGGANVANVLRITEQYMNELRMLNGLDDIAQWLAEILDYFTSQVFDVAGIKHRNAIYSAVDYMRENYHRHITLNEVADYVGYSHAYFSNIFKEEMHCSFRAYLNGIRIKKSIPLLLSGKFSISEICEMTGFPDQSSFGKVFKQETGTSPGKYRKTNRRIDIDKEHGIL